MAGPLGAGLRGAAGPGAEPRALGSDAAAVGTSALCPPHGSGQACPLSAIQHPTLQGGGCFPSFPLLPSLSYLVSLSVWHSAGP